MENLIDTSRQEHNRILNKLDQFIKALDSEENNKKTLATEINNYIERYNAICTTYTEDNQETLLIIVARKNINDITKLVTKKILDFKSEALHLSDNQGNTPLLHAAMANNTDFLEIIASFASYDMIKIKNNANNTAFMLAAQNNHKTFLEKMLELGFNISSEEKEQSLLLAAEYGHTAIVEFLLSKGVNPFIKDAQGNTPLMLACSNGDCETISLLRKQYGVKRQIFTMACLGRRLEEAAQIFPEGCIKKSVKHSGYLIKTAMYYLHNTANTQQLITLTFSINSFLKKFNEFIPHIIQTVFLNIETLFLGIECEKHVMNLFYVKSNNPNDILIEQNNLNTSRTRVPIPPLNLGGTASTEDLWQSRFRDTALSTRSSGYQTRYTSSVSGDNNIEHLTPSLLEITEQDQENFNDPGELNAGGRTSENAHLELYKLQALLKIRQGDFLKKQGEIQLINANKAMKRSLIDSPRGQETASTQSSGTSSRSLWLRNSSTTEASVQLSHTLSGFNITNEQASSSSNHQWQYQDGMSKSESLPRMNHDS